MWSFKSSISANKNSRNLQRGIKISLDQRLQSRTSRNVPIHKIGVWTYTITVCTRRHSSTFVAELNTLEELLKQKMSDIYVDDLTTGGDKITDVQILQDIAIQIFKEAGFASELEENNPEQSSTEQTYAKQQLSVKTGKTKMLGIK